jgi:hypothetical protein
MLTQAIFIFEVLLPASLFAPRPIFLCALAAMLVFHIACAVTMGLNTFVWAFAACYPAVLWSWQYLADTLSSTTRLAFTALWLVFAGMLLSLMWRRHRPVGEPPGSAADRTHGALVEP